MSARKYEALMKRYEKHLAAARKIESQLQDILKQNRPHGVSESDWIDVIEDKSSNDFLDRAWLFDHFQPTLEDAINDRVPPADEEGDE